MFTIAPNNDVFLGKINSLETTSQEIYINIVEEFLKSDNSINMSRFSVHYI
jgi:nitrous oxidase accessory protein NosD